VDLAHSGLVTLAFSVFGSKVPPKLFESDLVPLDQPISLIACRLNFALCLAQLIGNSE
jgi:hypothetical protein